ncbi:MAG TPA: pentapeptide repeat-containing protein [Thermoanaerobaculia bacterium]|nr:pentapeptide repeat-containing protein [Thermoanaerobaculia bacterium]
MKALAIVAALLMLAAAGIEAQPQLDCPKPAPGRPDFRGKNLTDHNFAGQNQDLRGADFTGAVLDGVQFSGVDLTGAVFQGASLKRTAKGRADFNGATLVQACFQGAILEQPNLQLAKLACADFSHTDLTQVDFTPRPRFDPGTLGCGRVKFFEATMRVRQIPFSFWRFTDFTRTRFLDLAADRAIFRGADLTKAMLPGAKLEYFDFSGATLIETDLRDSDLRHAIFTGAKARGIKLDGSDFRLAVAKGPDTDFTTASLRRVTGKDADLSGAVLESAVLRGANFPAADLRGTGLQGAALDKGEGLQPAEFSGANLSGAKLDNANLNFASFRNARLIGATFTGVLISDTDFSNAAMPNADFFGATLAGVSFQGSSLENASFRRATFVRSTTSGRGVDLSCTQLGGANLAELEMPPAEGAVTFLGAVLPPAAECRPVGNDFVCGTELAGRKPYGPTRLPALAHPATCPNGEFVICSGTTWLLENWKTNACGSPETRWVPPPRDPPPPGPTVNIPDANFKRCLSEQFFGDDRAIPTDFAATVLEIDCTSRDIADATGLEAFKALQKLTLTGNALTDGEIFQKLKALAVLRVSGNKLTTLNVGVATLKSVEAAKNEIQHVSGLETADLEFLDLSNNRLTAFALDSQRTLAYADLSHNALTDVGELNRGFGALQYLYLQHNDLITIGTLADATNLIYLGLGSNPKFRCDTLKVSKEILEASNCGKP